MSNVRNVRPRPSIRSVLQFLAGLLIILATQGLSAQTLRYVEYRSGWDAQNGFFKLYLYAAINPTTRAVQLSGGHLDFKDLDQPYKVLQAAGKKVPKLGPNQMAGDVFFSQTNIGITATMFTGQLTGALGAAGSTLTANNVRFDHRGRTYQVNFVLTPTSPTPGPSPSPTPTPSANLLFDNTNTNTVSNNPSAKTVVVLNQPTLVNQIWTYHWNNGRGAAPGTIALTDQSGRTYGPWPAVGSPGANGAANENWTASPNVTLPSGSYTVVDSASATWGQNIQSKGCGYTRVWGKAGVSPPPPSPLPSPLPLKLPPPSPSGPIVVLFDSSNTGGVVNNPTARTVFTLTKQTVVTQIWNYHWNNAQGAAPGSISLVDATGKTYGPWASKGSAGSNNVQNANWTVDANVTLPPGSYTIQDSSPATWAQNSQSGGRGFSKVWGH